MGLPVSNCLSFSQESPRHNQPQQPATSPFHKDRTLSMAVPGYFQTSEYFNAHPDVWDIIDFLDLCGLERDIAISRWLKSLRTIANDPEETPERQQKAQLLHDNYATDGLKRAQEWLKSTNGTKKEGGLTVYRGPVITAGVIKGGVRLTSVGNKRPGSRKSVNNKRLKTTEGNLVTEPLIKLLTDDDNDDDLAEAFDSFQSTYKTMEKKTPFSDSVNVLEDVVYQKVAALFTREPSALKNNPILSWIIDLSVTVVASWFEPDELRQLHSWKLPLPKTSESFAFSLGRFSKAQTVVEFRDIIEKTSCRPANIPYSPLRDCDATYVNVGIEATLSLIDFRKRYSKPFFSSLREGWFDSNVWGPLIDRCMQGLDGVLLNRKEIMLDALKHHSNKRFDAIFQAPDDDGSPEFGAIEVSRSVEVPPSMKHMADSIKLVIGLYAMLCRLQYLVDNDRDTIRRLQVVGILNTGFRIQIFRMNCLNTNVFLLDRCKERSVPTTAEHVQGIPGVIQSICCAKYMIQDCVAVTRCYSASKASKADPPGDFKL